MSAHIRARNNISKDPSGESEGFDEKRFLMIFFQIQAAHNLSYIPDLVSMVYGEENFYYVTIDRAASPAAARAVVSFLAPYPNIVVNTNSFVTWGGVSQVDVMLSGMNFMMQLRKFKYYINISDSDVPLWSLSRLCNFLRDAEASGRLAFITHWKPDLTKEPVTLGDEVGTTETSFRPDVQFVIDKRIKAYFVHASTSPIIKAHMRVSFVCAEQPAVKTLFVRPMMPFEEVARRGFLSSFPIYIGRQWMILHCKLLERMFSDRRFLLCYKMLSDMLIPDEMLLQTAILNIEEDKGAISNESLRFRRGDPQSITDADLPELRTCSAAFARKISIPLSSSLLDYVRDVCSNEIRSFHDFRLKHSAQ